MDGLEFQNVQVDKSSPFFQFAQQPPALRTSTRMSTSLDHGNSSSSPKPRPTSRTDRHATYSFPQFGSAVLCYLWRKPLQQTQRAQEWQPFEATELPTPT